MSTPQHATYSANSAKNCHQRVRREPIALVAFNKPKQGNYLPHCKWGGETQFIKPSSGGAGEAQTLRRHRVR